MPEKLEIILERALTNFGGNKWRDYTTANAYDELVIMLRSHTNYVGPTKVIANKLLKKLSKCATVPDMLTIITEKMFELKNGDQNGTNI